MILIAPLWWEYTMPDQLTYRSLVTPYGDIDLGKKLHMYWLVAWRHQAITWPNVDSSSVSSSDIHLRVISQEIRQPPITKLAWKLLI